MPVRFRCVYCNQLLGIAKRKAGSVVHCTSCNGQLIVPDPEVEASLAASHAGKSAAGTEGIDAASKLFERNDIDELLRPFRDIHEHKVKATVKTSHDSKEFSVIPKVSIPKKGILFDTSLTQTPRRPWVAVAAAILLAAIFFGLGFVAGRMSN